MSRSLRVLLLFSLLGSGVLLQLGGCNMLQLSRPGVAPVEPKKTTFDLPEKTSFRLPPYVFLADFEIDHKLPLFRELEQLRDQVYSELQLPDSNKVIKVYLFQSQEKYEQFIQARYPNLPRRRAFFVAQPRPIGGSEDLLVYTHWGGQIQEDLRHELTHALLHSVLKDVPLWLDEGLAEYFETPRGWSGVNLSHLEQIRLVGTKGFQPNLERLEKLREVQEMTPAEYREAWAWVHLMLRGHPQGRQVLLAYIRELRSNRDPGPLRPRLQAAVPGLEAALIHHLDRLEAAAPR
jgi:hypothetical protein